MLLFFFLGDNAEMVMIGELATLRMTIVLYVYDVCRTPLTIHLIRLNIW